jgi:hypothetical protein
MNTNTAPESRETSGPYISKINSLIAAGRESLIGNVLAEYDRADQAQPKPVKTAA